MDDGVVQPANEDGRTDDLEAAGTQILVEAVLFDLDGTLVRAATRHAVAADGATEALAELPPQRWAVVSRTGHDGVGDVLRSAGLPEPAVVVGGDDVPRQKPDPAGYRMAAAALGVDVHRCLVVEDSVAGVHAGHAAGALVLGLGPAGLHEAAQWQADRLDQVRFTAEPKGIRVSLP